MITHRLLLGIGLLGLALPEDAEAIPYFARKYGVSCVQCHSLPPKLNGFGEGFVAAGYRDTSLEERRTWPVAVWLSGRSESLPGPQAEDDHRAYANRVELISADAVSSWLSYFVEWRALSMESRGNGTLRDRSGRFEDLFVVLTRGSAELTVGQFRQVAQVDVSRRLSLSEPLVLSSGLPGEGTGTGREIGLRGFTSAGRSPAVRGNWTWRPRSDARWVLGVAVPFPGELSLPLTDSARVQASNELELKAKGVVIESFVRRSLWSVGGHVFFDHSDRYLASGLATGARGWLHWTGAVGVAKAGSVARGRWSVEAEAIPRSYIALGARLEDQASDDVPRAFLPHLNVHFPGTRYTLRATLEQRIQRDRGTTLFEVGAVF